MALTPWECKSVAGSPPNRPRLPTGPRPYSSVVAEMHDATEEYLETILEIEEEGVPPIRARLVERLGISAPAVSETVNRLVEQGYAQLLDNRSLRLTPKGRALAVSIVRRHRLAERLLTDVIGLEWEKVHREADRWEHAISADVEEKLVQLLGDPATCPHGNPIPGSAHKVDVRGSTALSRVDSGPVTVSRISEKVELDDDALVLLAGAQLIPGSDAVVVGPAPDGVIVKTASGEQAIPMRLADLMFVTPAP
jgi:DtxR family Mn-dependent transcriptional regulator